MRSTRGVRNALSPAVMGNLSCPLMEFRATGASLWAQLCRIFWSRLSNMECVTFCTDAIPCMGWGSRLNTENRCRARTFTSLCLATVERYLWPRLACQVRLYPWNCKPLLQWLLFECFVPVMHEGAYAQSLLSGCQKISTPSRSGPLLLCWILIMCVSVITSIAFRFFFLTAIC